METDNNLHSDMEEGVIRKGDSFFRTTNTDLAVLLLTIGVRPFKSNPVVKSVDAKGNEQIFFNLETHNADKSINCQQVLTDWKKGTAYIEKNPEDPVAVAESVFCYVDKNTMQGPSSCPGPGAAGEAWQ